METDAYERYRRRLHYLSVQAATTGFSTPPEIWIEIEDIQQKLNSVARHQSLSSLSKPSANVAIVSDYVSKIVIVLSKLQDRTSSLVPCLIDAMLISAKIQDQAVESYCYYELIGWQDMESDKLPKYRVARGCYTESVEGIKQVYQFLIGEQQMKECDVFAKESVIELYSMIVEHKIKAQMFNEMLTERDRFLQRLLPDKPALVKKSCGDAVSKLDIPATAQVYIYLSSYERILEDVRTELFSRLIGILVTKLSD